MIKRLDDLTIRKIAAGEVIHRPLNAVKELIENSIDASATDISISVDQGGLTKIVVSDNGTGIHENDFDLLFARHSTSKIVDVEDLNSLTTFGFRGEALASICSVSHVEVLTRHWQSDIGFR